MACSQQPRLNFDALDRPGSRPSARRLSISLAAIFTGAAMLGSQLKSTPLDEPVGAVQRVGSNPRRVPGITPIHAV